MPKSTSIERGAAALVELEMLAVDEDFVEIFFTEVSTSVVMVVT